MQGIRLSGAAWLLLKRLYDHSAELAICSDPNCYRFHIVTGGVHGEIVRNLTIEALVASGFLQRTRTCSPAYTVARKGMQALRRKGLVKYYGEVESEVPQDVSFQQSSYSILSCSAEGQGAVSRP